MEKTRTCEIFVDEYGILRVKILNGVTIDHEDVIDNFVVARHLTKGRPILKLIDASGYWRITKKARAFALKEDCPERTIAKAVLVNDFISKMINIIIIKRRKPQIPIRFFIFESEALKWLKSFQQK